MTQALADMRRDYTRDGLSEAQAPDEPFALFHQWFADAVKTEQPPVEANAMTLATVDQDGRPHCRILLLKGLDTQGFTFFTNYQSAKGEQLAARPFAAMTFFWLPWSARCASKVGWSRSRPRSRMLTSRSVPWVAAWVPGLHRKAG
jgi:pyridoxamine 5'-phosphate oxidase